MFALLLMIYLLPVAIVAGLLLRFIRWSLVMIIRLACRIVSLVWRMIFGCFCSAGEDCGRCGDSIDTGLLSEIFFKGRK